MNLLVNPHLLAYGVNEKLTVIGVVPLILREGTKRPPAGGFSGLDEQGVADLRFFPTGISLVIHPGSPLVPTVHLHLRYLQLFDADGGPTRAWFGGGADLTPYYPDDGAAVLFHQAMKDACAPYAADAYARFKRACDGYL